MGNKESSQKAKKEAASEKPLSPRETFKRAEEGQKDHPLKGQVPPDLMRYFVLNFMETNDVYNLAATCRKLRYVMRPPRTPETQAYYAALRLRYFGKLILTHNTLSSITNGKQFINTVFHDLDPARPRHLEFSVPWKVAEQYDKTNQDLVRGFVLDRGVLIRQIEGIIRDGRFVKLGKDLKLHINGAKRGEAMWVMKPGQQETKEHGKLFEWDEDGKLIKDITFEYGKDMEIKEWWSNGVKKSRGKRSGGVMDVKHYNESGKRCGKEGSTSFSDIITIPIMALGLLFSDD